MRSLINLNTWIEATEEFANSLNALFQQLAPDWWEPIDTAAMQKSIEARVSATVRELVIAQDISLLHLLREHEAAHRIARAEYGHLGNW
jgi:hypothetical protein